MKSIKVFFYYVLWIIVSLFIGIVYMRLVLGEIPNEESYNGFGFFLNLFYSYGIIYVGLIIGGIIAFFFILTDFFFLRKKMRFDFNSILVRISVLILISIFVGIIHYFLEKVIDII